MSDNTDALKKDPVLPYGRQWVDDNDVQAVAQALTRDFITTGPAVAAFEDALCRLTGACHAIACANGTAALHIACMALGLKPGDLGVTSPISFLASANCIEYCGARADFVDIDPFSLCLSPEQLAMYCRENSAPKVVIPVDFAGTPANLPAIKSLADQYGFHVIEDAAHALGSVYKAGSRTYACGACVHSDMAVFSFHPVKTITTGEGGAVTTNDDRLAQKLRQLRNHGVIKPWPVTDSYEDECRGQWYYEMHQPGFNYRLTDIQAALGLSQLNRLSEFKQLRQGIVARYNQAFSGIADVIVPPPALASTACPHLYPIRFRHGARIRRDVYDALRKDRIHCQVHYIPIYWQPYYAERYGYGRGRCPDAETYYSQTLSLPLFPGMDKKDTDRVIRRVLRLVDDLGSKEALCRNS